MKTPLSPPNSISTDQFVGRRDELAALTLLQGESILTMRSTLITGEAGIGKSRLVDEFVRSTDGQRVLRGCCYPSDQGGPYLPFVEMFAELRLTGRSPEIDGSDWHNPSADTKGKRAQLVQAITDAVVDSIDGQPTTLVVEDLQWADVGSLLILNCLADIAPAGLFVVMTIRSDEQPTPEARQLISRLKGKVETIELRGLSLSEVRTQVVTLIGTEYATQDEMRDLTTWTAGNPLFVREVMLYLQQSGKLRRLTLGDAVRTNIPIDSLPGIIDVRIRQLSRICRRTLAICAALGQRFSVANVAAAANETWERTSEVLHQCVSNGFLRRLDHDLQYDFAFAHPMIQLRLYHAQRAVGQRRLHAAIARSGSLSDDELARHSALAAVGVGDRQAVALCQAAAQRAEDVLAYESAARFWELGLGCTRTAESALRADLLRRLGWALWAAGNWTRAIEAWTECASLSQSLHDQEGTSEVALALGETYRFRLDLAESERWLEQALASLSSSKAKERSRTLALLASVRCLNAEPAEAMALLERARAESAPAAIDPIVGYWAAFTLLVVGDAASANRTARAALVEARRQKNRRAIALLAGGLVQYELAKLRPGRAGRYAGLLERAVDPTDAAGITQVLLSRALVFGYRGQWREVEEHCQGWIAEVRLAGAFQAATARMISAEAALALGDADKAVMNMRRALPDLKAMHPLAPLHLARALAMNEGHAEALSIVESQAPTVLRGDRFPTAAVVLSDVVSRLDAPELWKSCLRKIDDEPSPMLAVYVPVSVQRVRGRLASCLKHWTLAAECFDAAILNLEQGHAQWELAQTYYDYAEMRRSRRRRGDLERAAALQLKAEAVLRELGIEARPQLVDEGGGNGHVNLFALTGRELEVLALICEGRRNQEIAEELTVSPRTVERHVENIFAKIGINSRAEAIVKAFEHGLASPDEASSDERRAKSAGSLA